MENAIIVFVRNPILGQVKTRLAKTMGDANALKVYVKLLEHTHDVLQNIACHKFIFYNDGINTDDLWQASNYIKRQQAAGDLGTKMTAAFNEVFEAGYSKVVIVGSDCYDLTADIVATAFESLHKTDLVLGPAADGGYYLLGQKKTNKHIFEVKAWSTSSVLSETLLLAKQEGLSYTLLPVLQDVDEEKDVYFSY